MATNINPDVKNAQQNASKAKTDNTFKERVYYYQYNQKTNQQKAEEKFYKNLDKKEESLHNRVYAKFDSEKESKILSVQKNNDRRACLLVAPRDGLNSLERFNRRLDYIFGRSNVGLLNGNNEEKSYINFVRSQLGNIGGIMFPYTPKINMSYSVNYDTTDITHTNVAYNAYKNSPPPKIILDAKFTADTDEHAKYLLACIWFLQAMTKCDSGNGKTFFDTTGKQSGGGLPPPVLYLNAYNSLIDNIPVVISGFSFSYPDNKDFVNVLVTQSDTTNNMNKITNIEFFEGVGKKGTKFVDLYADADFDFLKSSTMSFWLPIEFDISLQFLIQPNIARENKIFNLEAYKLGLLKNSSTSSAFTQTGSIAEKGSFASVSNTDGKYNGKYMPTGWSW